MQKKGLDRRQFIRAASVGLAGGAAWLHSQVSLAAMMGGGMGGGGMGGGGMGGGTIDPPIGAAFLDPVAMPMTWSVETINGVSRNVATVNLKSIVSPVNINGVTANLMTYDGYYPGRLIRVRQGDILRVNFSNALPPTQATNILGFTKNITNLHTHGWHVSPMDPADNVMRQFTPGQGTGPQEPPNPLYPYLPYEYDLSLTEPGALSFYHPHIHGLTAEQVWGGLAGPIIMEDETNLLSGVETHVLVLKDLTVSSGAPAPYSSMDYMNGKEGSTIVVNGQVNPRLTARPGQLQRWRILNASNARFYKLSLANHTLQVIGTDGGLLDKPYPQSYILLSPGERVDVLVKASATKGNYKFLSLPYSRMGMMTSAQITLMTLSVSGTAVNNVIPASINPDAGPRLDPNHVNVVDQKTFTLSMMHGRGYINGYDFDVQPCQVDSMTGNYEIWTIVNQSNMDHPWHQHTNAGQVLSISGGDAAYTKLYTQTLCPAWKDVVIVPKMGSVKILMPVMDYCGMAMFHCHILEHEDIGMIGIWNIGMGM